MLMSPEIVSGMDRIGRYDIGLEGWRMGYASATARVGTEDHETCDDEDHLSMVHERSLQRHMSGCKKNTVHRLPHMFIFVNFFAEKIFRI